MTREIDEKVKVRILHSKRIPFLGGYGPILNPIWLEKSKVEHLKFILGTDKIQVVGIPNAPLHPSTPIEPEPPVDPEIPPTEPEQPPVEPPVDPEIPPTEPEQPPVEPPVDPEPPVEPDEDENTEEPVARFAKKKKK